MKTLTLFCVALISVVAGATLYGTIDPNLDEQDFIVVFKKDAAHNQQIAHLSDLEDRVTRNFDIGSFQGFAARLTPTLLKEQLKSEIVEYVEVNGEVHTTACTQQTGATWGLNRLNARPVKLDGLYSYNSDAGKDTYSFVVDTGIRITHHEFGGRAEWAFNSADNRDEDCNGHGTHVAGTIGGSTYGVAKKTTLIAVKVLNCAGSGTYDGVIAGIEFVAKDKRRPAVANMSLGGGFSQAINDAVAAAVAAGVTFAVAAGNDNSDACGYSPASEESAITVGATTIYGGNSDLRASFSNHATCVDIFAPGQDITSAWNRDDNSTNTISGTSMASPHVAGVAALYLTENPNATPQQVKDALVKEASDDLIDLNCWFSFACRESPNKLLFKTCA